jgi:single-stranded DNA-binding protein
MPPPAWETPEGDKRSVTDIEADEVGGQPQVATAKVERVSRRGNGDRAQGRERCWHAQSSASRPPGAAVSTRAAVAQVGLSGQPVRIALVADPSAPGAPAC